jgi:putative flavoprotein involved in K+ transport
VLPEGDVLVIGTGNSAALLSVELANHSTATPEEVFLSTNAPLDFKPLYLLGRSIFWWGEKTGLLTLSGSSPIGAWLKKKPQGIYCDELQSLIRKSRVSLVPEIDRFEGQEVVFKNGYRKKFGSIVWATGYRSDYGWLRIPGALDAQGAPVHRDGISQVDGLYWMGLVWQRSSISALIQGAGRDAQFVVGQMVAKAAVRFQPLSSL